MSAEMDPCMVCISNKTWNISWTLYLFLKQIRRIQIIKYIIIWLYFRVSNVPVNYIIKWEFQIILGNINNNEATSISPSLSSLQYPVNVSFYLDPNYINQVSGSPLHASVGEHVYVKVFTTTNDWNAKMRVHSCYTKPSLNAPDHTKYYLIQNG